MATVSIVEAEMEEYEISEAEMSVNIGEKDKYSRTSIDVERVGGAVWMSVMTFNKHMRKYLREHGYKCLVKNGAYFSRDFTFAEIRYLRPLLTDEQAAILRADVRRRDESSRKQKIAADVSARKKSVTVNGEKKEVKFGWRFDSHGSLVPRLRRPGPGRPPSDLTPDDRSAALAEQRAEWRAKPENWERELLRQRERRARKKAAMRDNCGTNLSVE